jgi:hypothetical protein
MSNHVRDGQTSHETADAVETDEEDVDRRELDARVEDLLDGDYVTFDEHNQNR